MLSVNRIYCTKANIRHFQQCIFGYGIELYIGRKVEDFRIWNCNRLLEVS